MAAHNELGKEGEDKAASYILSKGYKILDQNWRWAKNEIDIIARDGDCLVIIEVKTRKSNAVGEPEMAVTKEKQRYMIRAANAYVGYHNIEMEVRFDIISILVTKEGDHIHHIVDAFYPTLG